jgi:outer membrane protein TolC
MLMLHVRSARQRAIALLLQSLVLGGPIAGCRSAPSPAVEPLSVPAPPNRDSERPEVDRALYIPKPDPPPSRHPAPDSTSSREHPPGSIAPSDPATAAAPVESQTSFSLAEAIAYGLDHNPRLQQVSAQVVAARAGADIAFAPFLPEIGYHYIYAAFNIPVIPGGAFVPASLERGAFTYSLNEFGIQWTILDFGRRAGRYGQAMSKARAESLVLERARQTVAFDVASGYFQLLAARAEVRVREEAKRTAEAIRGDVGTRRLGGTAKLEDELRADVEVSRTSEELVAARQAVLDAEAVLNNALGRAWGGTLFIADVARRPPFGESLASCLERAAALRPEVGVARQEIAAAAEGERSAQGELLPKIYTRGTVIQAELPRVFHGWIDGAGIHADQSLYAGGAKKAAVHQAHAERDAAAAGLLVILNNLSAQVNLAYNAIATDNERIRLNSVAAGQARENLRVVMVRYNNGNAIPTEVVDAQTALTSAEVRYYASLYSFLTGLARLEYVQGGDLGAFLAQVSQAPECADQRIDLPRGADKGEDDKPRPCPDPGPSEADDLPTALPGRL